MILLCSSMLNGAHDASQLPVVMVGRGGGQIKHRPGARLSGQAEPQDVQPVPVDDGQGRRAPRPLRRCDRAPARGVSRPVSSLTSSPVRRDLL